MKSVISFVKMSGAGNDFIVIDNMDGMIDVDKPQLAVDLCSRRLGVGADGLLLLEASLIGDFSMRYFNADGSYGGMCGNGGRCVARYAHLRGLTQSRLQFEALGYLYSATVSDTSVKLWMNKPNDLRLNLLVQCGGEEFVGHFINSGSPHFVLDSSDLELVDVPRIGRLIRNHPLFAPEGCNVNFVSQRNENVLFIRTYERGVEAETLACGTGSIAGALIYAVKHGVKSPVTMNVRSGEQLTVYFDVDGPIFRNIVLEGSARVVFSGKFQYDPNSGVISDILPS